MHKTIYLRNWGEPGKCIDSTLIKKVSSANYKSRRHGFSLYKVKCVFCMIALFLVSLFHRFFIRLRHTL